MMQTPCRHPRDVEPANNVYRLTTIQSSAPPHALCICTVDLDMSPSESETETETETESEEVQQRRGSGLSLGGKSDEWEESKGT